LYLFLGAPADTAPLDKTRDEDVVVPLIKRSTQIHLLKHIKGILPRDEYFLKAYNVRKEETSV
jgi:hypothetical protein